MSNINLGGRPTEYTAEIGDFICEEIATGKSLNKICKDNAIPSRASVYRWLLSDNPIYTGFRDKYAQSRKISYEIMCDDIIDIADDGMNDWMENNNPENPGYAINGEALGRSRLRVDTRKWFLSKCLPKFADKTEVVPSQDLAAALQQLIDQMPN